MTDLGPEVIITGKPLTLQLAGTQCWGRTEAGREGGRVLWKNYTAATLQVVRTVLAEKSRVTTFRY